MAARSTAFTLALAALLAGVLSGSARSVAGNTSARGQIAFVSDRARSVYTNLEGIWLMSPGGGRARALEPLGARCCHEAYQPVWTPDGQRIAFVSTRGADSAAQIYTINPDGTHLRRLTRGRLGYGFPTFSPNGRMIAFTRFAAQIYRMNLDGSGLRQLTRERTRWDTEPNWSVTGRIAFTSERKGQTIGTSDIRVMNADGSRVKSLAHTSADEREPAWSPNGRLIAFSASQVSGQSDPPHRTWIYVMNANGSGRRALTHPTSFDDHDPTWSPDGRTIAFARTGDSGKGDIFLVNINGSGLRRLTSSGANDYLPAWAPR